MCASSQVISGLGIVYSIEWPGAYKGLLGWVGGIVSLDVVSILPLGCIMHFDHDSKLLFTELSMLALNIVFYLANRYAKLRGKTSRRFEGIKMRLMYIWVTANAFLYETRRTDAWRQLL